LLESIGQKVELYPQYIDRINTPPRLVSLLDGPQHQDIACTRNVLLSYNTALYSANNVTSSRLHW